VTLKAFDLDSKLPAGFTKEAALFHFTESNTGFMDR
jgi:hypothetical protein